jgi:hypothetical protein
LSDYWLLYGIWNAFMKYLTWAQWVEYQRLLVRSSFSIIYTEFMLTVRRIAGGFVVARTSAINIKERFFETFSSELSLVIQQLKEEQYEIAII